MERKKIYILLLLLILPVISNASAYWMDVVGSGKVNEPVLIKVYYGNIDEYGVRKPQKGTELLLTGDFKMSVVDEEGKRTAVPISLKGDCWEGMFIPHENGVYQILGINNTHPVVDRSKIGGENVLPIDYLCAAYQVNSAASVTKPLQLLDILTAKKDQFVIIKAFNKGIPAVKNTKLRVFNPENWEKELTIDEHGAAVFMPTMKGLYMIREDWVDPTGGTYNGVRYTSIRHRCNYCLLIL